MSQSASTDVFTALGIPQDKLLEMVLDRIIENLDGEFSSENIETTVRVKMNKDIQVRLSKATDKVVQEFVEKSVLNTLNNALLTPTNQWGERTGEPTTFLAYATKKADDHAVKVDEKGSPRDAYFSGKSMTRLAFLIDAQLAKNIEELTKRALGDFNKRAIQALNTTIGAELGKIFKALQTTYPDALPGNEPKQPPANTQAPRQP